MHAAALFLRELVPHHAADSRLETKTCPFRNLPEARRGQWGEGLTGAEMEKSRGLKPRLVVTIEYLEWTAANHLRLARFVGLSPRKR
jgi:bifunctional non-homologous end joining protein LigD